MVVYLRSMGHNINRKRVQRLMGILGLAGMAPGLSTSRFNPAHAVYLYLLRGLAVVKPNQVWYRYNLYPPRDSFFWLLLLIGILEKYWRGKCQIHWTAAFA